MLIEPDGSLTGVLSGGCLESDLATRAAQVQASGEAALATYDLRAPDEYLWGLGLGCGGKVTLLLEPLPGDARAVSPLAPFEQMEKERTPRDVVTRFAGEVVLRERITPTARLVLAGAGRDAVPLARLAGELGWETIVLDSRPTAAAAARFAGLGRFAGVAPRQLAEAVALDPWTAAVVLTHNYLDDLAWLAALLPTPAPYVGLLGPRLGATACSPISPSRTRPRRGDARTPARPRRPRPGRPGDRTGRSFDRRRDPGRDVRCWRHAALAPARDP